MPAERMAPFERRALTLGEVALARPLFADSVDYARVQVWQAPPLGFAAMAPFDWVVIYSAWPAARDFARAPLNEQGWFLHELAHVWQAARGVFLPLAKLKALGRAAYRYRLGRRTRFDGLNIEAQAEVARHLFLARAGKPAPEAAPLATLEAIWPVPQASV